MLHLALPCAQRPRRYARRSLSRVDTSASSATRSPPPGAIASAGCSFENKINSEDAGSARVSVFLQVALRFRHAILYLTDYKRITSLARHLLGMTGLGFCCQKVPE